MMAMLSQWLGLEPKEQSRPTSGITISAEGKKRPPAPTVPLRKTKSEELLRDLDVMRFLGAVDERLKEDGAPLARAELERLQTLYAQACADECGILLDIIEHFELENDKLRHRLALASPSSAAADALMARRNALVC